MSEQLSRESIVLLAKAYGGTRLTEAQAKQLPDELAKAASALVAAVDPFQTLWNAGLTDDQITQVKNAAEWRDPWQAFTLTDAYATRPPLAFVVAGLLSLPSLTILYGAPGTLKTMLAMDMMVCVAGGKPWLPPAPWAVSVTTPVATQTAPSVWVDFDNGRRRTHERFEALAQQRHLPVTAPLYYYSMPLPWLDATDSAEIRALTIRLREKNARLVVIDNLGAVTGNADENSADMIGVMSGFRQLAEDTSSAVVLIHHQRKSNGYNGRSGDSLRGHSSIEAAIDLALLVERDGQSDLLTIAPTKVRGSPVQRFNAIWNCTLKPDAAELCTAMFYGSPSEADGNSDKSIELSILDVIAGHAMNKTELKSRVKQQLPDVGINRIGAVIDRLIGQHKLKTAPGERMAQQITLPQ